MATRRIVTPKKTGTGRTSAPKDTTAKSSGRVPPVKMMRTQVAPHVKTLANGQPRPKSRRSK
jgi:hypothetical protein